MLKRIAGVCVLAVLCGSLFSNAFAQGGNATLSGTVFDQGQAVLPGVTVTVTNEATGIVREATTGAEGQFVVPTLTPGVYTVRVDLAGFQGQAQQGLVLRIGQELNLTFTLGLASVAETVTVTGQTPIVEVTASRIGSMITTQEIDGLPSQGYNHLSLMQIVPGMTPALTPGEFEGGNFNVNGRSTASNMWTVDGAANQDTDGGGTGPQARIALDAMAEFQVLTHQYTAEYGGSSGVIVNAVTKSGTNQFSGRGFFNFEDDKLRAIDPFLEADGEDNPEGGRRTFGFNVGGPIVRNKAFFFFNLERNLIDNAVVHSFPSEAAAIATDYADASVIHALSTYARGDYTAGNHNFSFRWQREVAPALGEDFECCQTLDNRQVEFDENDRMINASWTALFGSRATNEVRFSHVGEDRVDGNLSYAGLDPSLWNSSGWIKGMEFVGLNGRDQFDIGSMNDYADFTTGLAAAHGGADSRNYTLQDAFTYVTGDGDHTLKTGFTFNRVMVKPQRIGANDNGTFTFRHNTPFSPANARTYPSQFSIVLGDIEVNAEDDWTNAYLQDQWRVNQKLTLNLGLRFDYQDLTPETKAFAPRVGFAYDPTGEGRTVIRGGFGKFYEYHLIPVAVDLARRGVYSTVYTFNTGEDRSADIGIIPTSHICLQPSLNGQLAAISPACRSALTSIRSSLQPGAGAQFVNDEPVLDGDREMGYLWGYSLGVKRELMTDIAASVDWVGNRGRDQTGIIDINEGPPGPNGRVTRVGVDVFDPDGTLIPPEARGVAFRRVLQFQTRDDLNTDFDSLELSMEKRHSNRWSSRVAYTLSYSNDVGPGSRTVRYMNDLNPRDDYGRSNADNRHSFVTSANYDVWRGLSVGGIFKYYSGNPINETIGADVNADRDNNDRPRRGIDDLVRPILSPLDSNGIAIRNGIDGNSVTLLDLRAQYLLGLPQRQSLSFFVEVFNALNKINYGNPTGNRNSANFMIPVEAGTMRSAQMGIRYTF